MRSDATVIHTHMCYAAEFMTSPTRSRRWMRDVVSTERLRSRMELLEIHALATVIRAGSPWRTTLLARACRTKRCSSGYSALGAEQIWRNPDFQDFEDARLARSAHGVAVLLVAAARWALRESESARVVLRRGAP
jgi:hypothetical protein